VAKRTLNLPHQLSCGIKRGRAYTNHHTAPPPKRAAPSSPLHADMPPHHNSSGFHGVRARPAGNFYAEIHVVGYRLTLRTFETGHKATRTYRVAARPSARRPQLPRHQLRRSSGDIGSPTAPCHQREEAATPLVQTKSSISLVSPFPTGDYSDVLLENIGTKGLAVSSGFRCLTWATWCTKLVQSLMFEGPEAELH
jgi:hypothetical protein